MLARLLALALLESALADIYTYPVKSINLGSAMAPAWYEGMDPSGQYGPVTDFHPVHGTTASDGGFVVVGMARESESTETKEAFALKFSSSGSFVWGWKSGSSGEDAANAVLELSGGDLLVAGYRTVNGEAKSSLTKLSESGSEIWTGTSFEDGSMAFDNWPYGAWEMISATSDGILLAGLESSTAEAQGVLNFKSYGNPLGGIAFVMKLPMSSVAGNAAPTSSDADWTKSFPGYTTMKAARSLSNGNIACLMWEAEYQAGVVMLSSSGTILWDETDYHTAHGKATDLQVSADGSSLFLSGHGHDDPEVCEDNATFTDDWGNSCGDFYDCSSLTEQGYSQTMADEAIANCPETCVLCTDNAKYAKLTKISASDGAREWTKSYTAGGNPKLIYNECWGVTVMSDGGLTLACRTGIEECTDDLTWPFSLPPSDLSDCQQGLGDKRANALPRGAGVWQALVIRTDSSGELLWQRVDSYRNSSAPALEASSMEDRTSSAAEWGFLTSEGDLTVVMDEVFGVGLMKLASDGEGGSSSGGGGESSSDGEGTTRTSFAHQIPAALSAMATFAVALLREV